MNTPPRVIRVRLFRKRFWEVFERPGVEPLYYEKRQAVYYAEQRGRLGNAVVRIYDEAGNVEREIMPAPEDRMLYRGNTEGVVRTAPLHEFSKRRNVRLLSIRRSVQDE